MATTEPKVISRKLAGIFTDFRDHPFILIRPGGNWGDELIYYGAESLATDLGIQWRSLSIDEFTRAQPPPATVVYLHGGGGFNPWCSGRAARNLLTVARAHAGIVIQGPQTFAADAEYAHSVLTKLSLETKAERTILFARENTSYELLCQTRIPSDNVEIYLDHDTAFNADPKRLMEIAGPGRRRYNLLAFRIDNEASRTLPNVSGIRLDPAYYAKSFAHWLRIHANSKSITTNRLHSAVAGSLLGVPTMLLPASYHKNRSIWQFSLQSTCVSWGEYSLTGAGAPRLPYSSRLFQTLSRSYKFESTFHFLRTLVLSARGVPFH